MPENEINPQSELRPEPELRQTKEQPKGVLQKNLKTFVYLGAALLVIVAALFSSSSNKTPSQQVTKGQPPQPMLQDNTDNNVRDLKSQVQAERQKDQQAALAATAQDPALAAATGLSQATPAQQVAAAAYGPTGVAAPCAPGQPARNRRLGTDSLTRSRSLHLSSSRCRRSPQRSVNEPMSLASLQTLSTRGRPISNSQHRTSNKRRGPLRLPARVRWTPASFRHALQGTLQKRLKATSDPSRQISTRPQVSRISCMKERFSTPF